MVLAYIGTEFDARFFIYYEFRVSEKIDEYNDIRPGCQIKVQARYSNTQETKDGLMWCGLWTSKRPIA